MSIRYIDNKLCIGQESIELEGIVGNSSQPLYAYDWDEIMERLASFRAAFKSEPEVHYAVKANANPEILRRFAQMGIGADVVSVGEILQALNAGFPAGKIIFSGVGKTREELEFAITEEIEQINVESLQELERIADIAKRLGKRARVGARINPDVDPDTHPYITTGFRENKFGMDPSFIPELLAILEANRQHLDMKGTAIHIGSQLLDVDCIVEAVEKTIPIYQKFQRHGFELETFDVGGGLGVNYHDCDNSAVWDRIRNYGALLSDRLQGLGCRIFCEPGRILVGPAGVLVSEVQYIKRSPFKNFAILNTGMHHILRPSLYQAYHRILPLLQKTDSAEEVYDVVGPICESSDVLGKDRKLPRLEPGDFIAIADAGAYGFSMASFYNAHRFPREILVEQGKWKDVSQFTSQVEGFRWLLNSTYFPAGFP